MVEAAQWAVWVDLWGLVVLRWALEVVQWALARDIIWVQAEALQWADEVATASMVRKVMVHPEDSMKKDIIMEREEAKGITIDEVHHPVIITAHLPRKVSDEEADTTSIRLTETIIAVVMGHHPITWAAALVMVQSTASIQIIWVVDALAPSTEDTRHMEEHRMAVDLAGTMTLTADLAADLHQEWTVGSMISGGAEAMGRSNHLIISDNSHLLDSILIRAMVADHKVMSTDLHRVTDRDHLLASVRDRPKAMVRALLQDMARVHHPDTATDHQIISTKIQGTEATLDEGTVANKMTRGTKSFLPNNRMSTEASQTKKATRSAGIGQIRKWQKIANILCYRNLESNMVKLINRTQLIQGKEQIKPEIARTRRKRPTS